MGRPDFPRSIMEFQERFLRGPLPRVPGRLALAGRLSLPGLRRRARLGARAPPPLGVRRLPSPGLGHGGDGDAQDPYAASAVVLGGLPGRHPHPGDLGQAAQRQLGLTRRDLLAHAPEARRAMVAPEREPLRARSRSTRASWAASTRAQSRPRPRRKAARGGCRRGSRHCSGRLRLAALPNARAISRRVRERERHRRERRPHRRLARLRPARRTGL